ARWVAANISNVADHDGPPRQTFAAREGFCRARSDLFERMLRIVNIHAEQFAMFNFPSAGQGHNCVQAWFEGQWHFFDVTYAGCFVAGGRVLSGDEVRAAPEAALQGLVVFPETRDTVASPPPTGTHERASNEDRMRSSYPVDVIRAARSCGSLT